MILVKKATTRTIEDTNLKAMPEHLQPATEASPDIYPFLADLARRDLSIAVNFRITVLALFLRGMRKKPSIMNQLLWKANSTT